MDGFFLLSILTLVALGLSVVALWLSSRRVFDISIVNLGNGDARPTIAKWKGRILKSALLLDNTDGKSVIVSDKLKASNGQEVLVVVFPAFRE